MLRLHRTLTGAGAGAGAALRRLLALGAHGEPVHIAPAPEASRAKHSVAFIGSGNWGSAAARVAAQNTLRLPAFEAEVRMWVFDEEVSGRKLSDVINTQHENVKYLPGIHLGPNVRACPDLLAAVADASVLVLVTPHQYLRRLCEQLRGRVAPQAIAVSLTKGMDVRPDGPQLLSSLVHEVLGLQCSVLMGANVARDVALEQLSQATLGARNENHAEVLTALFHRPYFNVSAVSDVEGVEMCGTLKNVVALGAGFVDGLQLGANTKAAIMCSGLNEMRGLAKALFPSVQDTTFFESCGVGDVIATCTGGRNRKVAEAFVLSGGKSWTQLEAELLSGQKLQGLLTSNEVSEVLRHHGWENRFPLFTTINRIANGHVPPSEIVNFLDVGAGPHLVV